MISDGNQKDWPIYEELNNLEIPMYSYDDIKEQYHSNDFEEVIKSPGVPFHHPFFNSRDNVITEIELGVREIGNKPIIGITGTNGKTTTTMMTEWILQKSGQNVFCGGNIGRPLCEGILSDENYDCYLLELSSFQLECMRDFKIQYAAILNFSAHHGEHHGDVTEYKMAKAKILSGNVFSISKEEDDFDSHFKYKQDDIDELRNQYNEFDSDTFFHGKFNWVNLYVAKKLSESYLKREVDLKEFLNEFQGPKFRLEYIGDKSGFKFYNDSKSTNWDSLMNALKSFEGKVILIMGGKLRGENDSIAPYRKIIEEKTSHVFFIGESGGKLVCDYPLGKNCKTLENVRTELEKITSKGVVLFSPAFPSFDQFKNYIERGEVFNQTFSF